MTSHDFDVALSFAGEDRHFVEAVATHLKSAGVRVFYDRDQEIYLWGRDLAETFDDIYQHRSRYVVFFISAHYAAKMWTRHERRSSLARALVEKREYILPARFDDTPLPGLPHTVGYLDLANESPETFSDKLVAKITGSAPAEGEHLHPVGEVRTLRGHTSQITSLRFSADDARALSGSLDTTMRLWDLRTGQELRRFAAHTGAIHDIAWSADNRYALSGSGSDISLRGTGLIAKIKIEILADKTRPEDYGARLWDVTRGVQLHRFSTIKAQAVALHPAGTHFLCATYVECELWNIVTGTREAVIPHASHDVYGLIKALQFSNDGAMFYIASGRHVDSYETNGAKHIRELQLVYKGPVQYAFASDGIHVVRSADDTLTVTNLLTGKVNQSAKFNFSLSIDVAPDLDRVIGQEGDGCRLMDLTSGHILFEQYEQYDFTHQAVAISHDGLYGLTGSTSGDIRFWRFPPR